MLHDALSRIAAAIIVDVKGRRRRFDDVFACAINAVLVLTGIRSAARFEYYFNDEAIDHVDTEFVRELRRIAESLPGRRLEIVTFGGDASEPLLVDLDRLDARDVETLRTSVGGDMQEPLVSAMGRVLGYPHPPLTASDMADGVFTVVFEAVVTGVRGGSQAKEYLASVGCRSMEDAAAVRVVLERDWLVPSIRAMAGATVVGPGRHMYVVQGFELNLVSLRM